MDLKEFDTGGYCVYLTWLFRNSLNFCKRSGKINDSCPPDFCQEQLRKLVFKKTAEQTHDVESYARCCGLLPFCARSSVAADAENGRLFSSSPALGTEIVRRQKLHVCFRCVFSKYYSRFVTGLPLAETVLIPILYLHGKILVICPPVWRAKALAFSFFTQFSAVSLPYSGQVGLLCTGCLCLKYQHLVSL